VQKGRNKVSVQAIPLAPGDDSNTLTIAHHCEQMLYFIASNEKSYGFRRDEQQLYAMVMSGELSGEQRSNI